MSKAAAYRDITCPLMEQIVALAFSQRNQRLQSGAAALCCIHK